MEDNVSKIKDRLDIIDVVGSYVKLHKAGVNLKANCPFHNEKTGSFFVSPERQIWHCFGCNSGGDMFTFIERIEGVEFSEALRILANRAGVELTFDKGRRPEGRDLLLEITELATRFFEKQLRASVAGERALKYLYERGVTDDSIKTFRLGFAPDQWQALSDFLGQHYSTDKIAAAGLSIMKESGGQYDRFRSRIMFPIRDVHGQVVGFTGRVFEEATAKTGSGSEISAKYVNTPQSAIYDKSRILYGLDLAKLNIRQRGRVLLVEGNMDVIMSHQAGVNHTVATSGTALTEVQITLLKRYTETLDMCFDADAAGAAAMERGVLMALAQGLSVNVVAINQAGIKDPADYVKADVAGWVTAVSNPTPFMEYYFKTALKQADVTTGFGKKMFTKKLLPFIAAMSNKVEQAHWISELALTLKVKEAIIESELASIKLTRPSSLTEEQYSAPRGAVAPTLPAAEEDLLSLIFKQPILVKEIPDSIRNYLSSRFSVLLSDFMSLYNKGLTSSDIASALRADAKHAEIAMAIDIAYLKSQEFWLDLADKTLALEFNKILNLIRRRQVISTLDQLQFDIRIAEQKHDVAMLKELLARFAKISRDLVD